MEHINQYEGITMNTNIYDLSVTDRTGATVPLSAYKGKVLLIVNTATDTSHRILRYNIAKLDEITTT